MKNLEPFIITNRIKYIPNESFREIAQYYATEKKLKVL